MSASPLGERWISDKGEKTERGLPSTMKIIVISDTHGVLRPEVESAINSADAVIHGGDFATEKNYNDIKAALKPGAPFFAVRGNNDRRLDELPETLEFTLGGLKFFLIHNKKDMPDKIDADIVIFGHTHKYFCETRGGRLWLNPGSCGRRRFNLPVTWAELTVENEEYSVKSIDISETAQILKMPKDPSAAIRGIIKRLGKGESSYKIAKKLGLDPDFTEQVIRMIATHPGIDEDGILNRINKE